MSQAFVKEGDEQWLHDIPPTIHALIAYLTRENNGIRVNEKSVTHDTKSGRDIHLMSNGMSYAKDKDGRWEIIF
jgi:hypothetical protein